MVDSTRFVDELCRSNGGLTPAAFVLRGFLPPSWLLVGTFVVANGCSASSGGGSSWISDGSFRLLLRGMILSDTVAACSLVMIHSTGSVWQATTVFTCLQYYTVWTLLPNGVEALPTYVLVRAVTCLRFLPRGTSNNVTELCLHITYVIRRSSKEGAHWAYSTAPSPHIPR